MMADLSDQLAAVIYYSAAAAGVKRPRKPVPYPRPEALTQNTDRIGTPTDVDTVREWLEKRNGTRGN